MSHPFDATSLYEGVRIMHKVAWDEAIDEGIVKGQFRTILAVGRKRFGDPDPKIEAALTAIQDPDRLERMAEVILTVKSWKALLLVK